MTSWPWIEWVVLAAAVVAGVAALAYAAWVRRDLARMAAAEEAQRERREADKIAERDDRAAVGRAVIMLRRGAARADEGADR